MCRSVAPATLSPALERSESLRTEDVVARALTAGYPALCAACQELRSNESRRSDSIGTLGRTAATQDLRESERVA